MTKPQVRHFRMSLEGDESDSHSVGDTLNSHGPMQFRLSLPGPSPSSHICPSAHSDQQGLEDGDADLEEMYDSLSVDSSDSHRCANAVHARGPRRFRLSLPGRSRSPNVSLTAQADQQGLDDKDLEDMYSFDPVTVETLSHVSELSLHVQMALEGARQRQLNGGHDCEKLAETMESVPPRCPLGGVSEGNMAEVTQHPKVDMSTGSGQPADDCAHTPSIQHIAALQVVVDSCCQHFYSTAKVADAAKFVTPHLPRHHVATYGSA